jgi:succinoglycan biosynthesis protein ExoA
MEDPISFVSIIMPALNEEVYIRAALETISDIPPQIDYEILVMDGGSTDATRRIVLEAAKANARITLCENPRACSS